MTGTDYLQTFESLKVTTIFMHILASETYLPKIFVNDYYAHVMNILFISMLFPLLYNLWFMMGFPDSCGHMLTHLDSLLCSPILHSPMLPLVAPNVCSYSHILSVFFFHMPLSWHCCLSLSTAPFAVHHQIILKHLFFTVSIMLILLSKSSLITFLSLFCICL